MVIEQSQQEDVLILRIQGTLLGGPEGEEFRRVLYEAVRRERNRIVLDLSGVHWMNSSGLGMLVAGLSTIRASGGEMVLANVPDRVLRPLQLTRLEGVFKILPSVEEAIAELRAEGP
jgi:anti-sigma B factor antagonist